MNYRTETLKPLSRRLTCANCGTEFGCDLSGNCWCAEETAKLPMPTTGGDCLCRDCLRAKAAAADAEHLRRRGLGARS